MSHPYFSRLRISCAPIALLIASWPLSAGQTPPEATHNALRPPSDKEANSPKAAAYYHFALGHMYEELAATYGNRTDYINKAIENYKLAMKEDPNASFLVEDIAELYRVSGRTREAVEEAEDALKSNPDDLNARRVLAHIYTQQIGDSQSNHIDEGMARRAVEQYKIITEKDPKDVESLVMLGRLDRVLQDSVDAEAAFKKVLAVDPDNEDAITGLASVYLDRGDARGSSELLEKLTKKNPSARAYASLASAYESMNEFSLAADAYQKALELDPSHTELQNALAEDQARAGRYDDALKTYQSMAAASPQDPQPYLGMEQIYRQRRDFANARKALDKAKQLDPDNLEIRYQEIGLLEDEGKTPEAIAALKGLLDSTAHRNYNPAERSYRSKMLYQLGYLYRQNDQNDQAVEAFRQIATVDPDAAAAAEAEIINTYRLAKDYAKAEQESEAASKKYPNDASLTEARADLLSDQGKTEQAIAELKKLMDGKNNFKVDLAMADVYQKGHNYAAMAGVLDDADKLAQTTQDKASVGFLRGAMYEREKKYDQAEKAFRQVLDLDPSNASALNYLGYMLADQNVRLQEAHDLIAKAVKLDPNNYAYLDSLGWVYYRMNRLDDAEQQLARSVQLWPKDPTIHDHLGDVYFKQGKIREAIAQWESSLKDWNASAPADVEPDEVAKVQKKLDSARVRLAKEEAPKQQ